MFPGVCHSQSHLANHNKPKQHSKPIRTRNENGQPAKSAEKRYASDWLKRILRLWLVGIKSCILYLHCQQSKTTQTQRYASLEAQGQLSCTSEVKWKRRRKIGKVGEKQRASRDAPVLNSYISAKRIKLSYPNLHNVDNNHPLKS